MQMYIYGTGVRRAECDHVINQCNATRRTQRTVSERCVYRLEKTGLKSVGHAGQMGPAQLELRRGLRPGEYAWDALTTVEVHHGLHGLHGPRNLRDRRGHRGLRSCGVP